MHFLRRLAVMCLDELASDDISTFLIVFDKLNNHCNSWRDVWCITLVKPGNTRKHFVIENTIAISRWLSRYSCCHMISLLS
jgi:hypothetical protein